MFHDITQIADVTSLILADYPELGQHQTKNIRNDNIPQSEGKGKKENRRIAQDAEYEAAVERGDMETAQRMVDEAAEAAGYTLRGYHGTKQPTLRYDRDG